MTDFVVFLIDFIVKCFHLALSFKFELFGFQVSLMSLELGAIIIITYVKFLNGTLGTTIPFIRNSFSKTENRKDKKDEKAKN